MRIGIDCRLGGSRHAGIGRYIENLILRLPLLDPAMTWVYFYYDDEQQKYWSAALAKAHNVEWVKTPVRHYSISEQLTMPGFFSRAKLDLLHIPHFNIPLFYPGRLIITIHDLLWHEYYGTQVTTLPQWQYWFKYVAYRWVTRMAILRAERVLVPAETIKQTVAKYFPRQLKKVVVTTEGASPTLVVSQARQSIARKTAKKHQLLYVGSLYPHKNLAVVIKALKELPTYQLVVVGARTVFQDQTKALVAAEGVSDQVTFAGFMPDEVLSQLFQTSLALVQPSLSEGFGLTGLEAMAAGIPLIASDIPIFREIYQTGAIFFDPHQPEDFIRAVRTVETTQLSSLIKTGQRIAAQYSWDAMAKETLRAYQEVAS